MSCSCVDDAVGLMKLPRLLRLGRLSRKIDVLAAGRALRIVILLAGFTLLAHILGCCWYFIGTQLISVRAGTALRDCTCVSFFRRIHNFTVTAICA